MVSEQGVNVYALPPMDFLWGALPTIGDFYKSLVDEYDAPYAARLMVEIEEFKARSLSVAERAGWEGDFRNEPRVLLLPVDPELEVSLIWKQDNNGTTFVASRQILPWLKGLEF